MKIFLALFMLLPLLVFAQSRNDLSSPDGKLIVKFRVESGVLQYSVKYDSVQIIRPSEMGFILKDAKPLKYNFAVESVSYSKIDETWQTVWGADKNVVNQANEMQVTVKETADPFRTLVITFRAYNDGIAFNYDFPEQPNLTSMEILSEDTYYRLGDNFTAWWHPADYDGDEQLYKTTPASEMRQANTPVTMRTKEGIHVSIHEAALLDYASTTLLPVPGEWVSFRSELVPWSDGVKVKWEKPHRTPWRVILVTPSAGKLIESYTILNLNEPNKIKDVSFIEPMVYMGIWWSLHLGKETWTAGSIHGATTENAKKHIDFAAKNGIRGLLIEGWNTGWENWGQKDAFTFLKAYPDFDLPEVARYAKEKGVMLIGHHETGGDIPMYEREMEDAFKLYHEVGVGSVKTGYAGPIYPRPNYHHGQYMVRHYQKVVETAAKYQITLDVHEPIKFTGISRTYPNLMTGEGVRGTEYEAWSIGNLPEHTTIFPFTRMLGGPIDYTPGIFELYYDKYKKDERIHTTLAKQLALMVVIYSPLQMAADLIENYENNPAFEFIKKLHATWDESHVLNGEIGDFVTIARRYGSEWFIGSITDEQARQFEVPLTFLESGKKFVLHRYTDGPTADWETKPYDMLIDKHIVDSNANLKIALGKGGGSALYLVPATDEEIKSIPAL